MFNALIRDESGATAIEYGLIAGLVSVVIIAALTLLGGNLSTMFDNLANALPLSTGASRASVDTRPTPAFRFCATRRPG